MFVEICISIILSERACINAHTCQNNFIIVTRIISNERYNDPIHNVTIVRAYMINVMMIELGRHSLHIQKLYRLTFIAIARNGS